MHIRCNCIHMSRKTMNNVLVFCRNIDLTVNSNRDRELHEVGAGHHHAGECLLVLKCGLGDEQVGFVIDADPVGIIVCGLNCGLVTVGLFDQQIAGRANVPFLKHAETRGRDSVNHTRDSLSSLSNHHSLLRHSSEPDDQQTSYVLL